MKLTHTALRPAALLAMALLLSCVSPWLKTMSVRRREAPTMVVADSIDGEASGAHSFGTFAKDRTWRAGVQRVLAIAVGAREPWNTPPAGQPAVASLAVQSATVPDALIGSLGVGKAESDASIVGLVLKIEGATKDEIDLDQLPIFLPQAEYDSDSVLKLVIQRRRGFFPCLFRCGPVTDAATVTVARLRAGPVAATLRSRQQGAQDSATQGIRIPLSFRVSSVEAKSGADSSAATPNHVTAGTQYDDEVSLHAFDRTDHILVRSNARYTYALVFAPNGSLGDVSVLRSDTRASVGVRSPRLPLFAVATNDYAALLVRVTDSDRTGVRYSLLSASGSQDEARRLILWFLGQGLPDLTRDGLPLAGSDLTDAVKWVSNAFGVELRPQDIEVLPPRDSAWKSMQRKLLQFTR